VSTVELFAHRIQFKNRTSIKMKRVRLYRAGAAGWRGRRGMDFRANLAMSALLFCQNEGLGTFLSAPGRSSRSIVYPGRAVGSGLLVHFPPGDIPSGLSPISHLK